jgi:hypothetical protein
MPLRATLGSILLAGVLLLALRFAPTPAAWRLPDPSGLLLFGTVGIGPALRRLRHRASPRMDDVRPRAGVCVG